MEATATSGQEDGSEWSRLRSCDDHHYSGLHSVRENADCLRADYHTCNRDPLARSCAIRLKLPWYTLRHASVEGSHDHRDAIKQIDGQRFRGGDLGCWRIDGVRCARY
jgi:hypothetical protein